jgi:hypothetical protein
MRGGHPHPRNFGPNEPKWIAHESGCPETVVPDSVVFLRKRLREDFDQDDNPSRIPQLSEIALIFLLTRFNRPGCAPSLIGPGRPGPSNREHK